MYQDPDINGKKLLLLGGVQSAAGLVDICHRNGARLGVTDYNKGTYIKKIADEAFDVDAFDTDAVAQLCRDNGSRHFRSPRGFIPRGLFVCVATRHRLPTHHFFCLSINLSVFSLAPFHSAKTPSHFPNVTVPLPYPCTSCVGLAV